LTQKIYCENSYITECESNIIDIIEKDGKHHVVLDRTPFYPEGGGQPSDTGTIDGIDVFHVYEEEDLIYHVTERKPENKTVKCIVNFDRRFDHMQQHSGEHLLSGAFFRLYKGVNCGFHLGDDYVTIDINLKEVTEEMLRQIEEETNKYIFSNVEVYTYIVDKDKVSKLPMRKEVKVEENIRIVQMGDADYSACCGTHVARTGEIGLLKIVKAEKYKGMTRIYFKCGKRALEDYTNKHNIISTLGKFLSAEENSIFEKVQAQASLVKELNRKISETKKLLAEIEVDKLIKEAKSSLIIKNYEDKALEDVQYISAALENENFIVILSSIPDKRVIMSQNGNFDISFGKLFKEKLPAFNGKGGGNDKKAQAAFGTEGDLSNFVNSIIDIIKE
jgi:alanyl-tRNA synthetase